jgi:hypothetical protein
MKAFSPLFMRVFAVIVSYNAMAEAICQQEKRDFLRFFQFRLLPEEMRAAAFSQGRTRPAHQSALVIKKE